MIKWRIGRVYRTAENGKSPVLFNSIVDNLRINRPFKLRYRKYHCFCDAIDQIIKNFSWE